MSTEGLINNAQLLRRWNGTMAENGYYRLIYDVRVYNTLASRRKGAGAVGSSDSSPKVTMDAPIASETTCRTSGGEARNRP